MRQLQSILLATDFKPASRVAAEVGVHLARVFGSRVTVLHAEEPIPSWPVVWHQRQAETAHLLDQLSQTLRDQRISVERLPIQAGRPAELIVRKASEIDADLILMGSGELSTFDRYAPGPVAEAVIQHAQQPVLAVHPGREAQFQSILCPVDGSAVSLRGLRNAVRLAKAFQGRLVVLMVVPTPSWLTSTMEIGQFPDSVEHDRAWRKEFDAHIANFDFDGVQWSKEVRTGHVAQEIAAAAAEHGSDVIVMGSTGRTGLAGIVMGSVARRVLQRLPCSLLTVKNEDVVDDLDELDVRTVNLLFAEGQALLASRSYEPAANKFGQVLARNPFHLGALEARATACLALGQLERAERSRRRSEAVRKMSAVYLGVHYEE